MTPGRIAASAVLVAGSLCALWATQPAAAGDRHVDSEIGWSVEVPAGWTVVDGRTMAERAEAAGVGAAAATAGVQFLAGFAPPGDDPRAPYAVAQWMAAPLAQATWEDLEEGLAGGMANATRTTEDALGGLVSDTSIGRPVFDRTHARMVFQFTATGPDGRRRSRSVGHLAKDGILHLHCYAMEDEFDRYVPMFETMLQSFAWDDPDRAFDGEVRSGIDWGRALGRGAIFGLIVGGVSWLMRGRKKKDDGKPRRRPRLPPGPGPGPGPGVPGVPGAR